MPDVFSEAKRSEVMRKVRGYNTKPEIIVRAYLFSKGLRFRIHCKNLIGKPDIVLKKYKTIVFVHGCFWHGHLNCKYFKIPQTNTDFWIKKINHNVAKDILYKAVLEQKGWRVLTIWECSLRRSNKDITLSNLYNAITL